MSDRCSMTITCRACDRHVFEEILEVESCLEPGGKTATVSADEVNSAGGVFDGSPGILPDAIPYWGVHGGGWDYGPGAFVCDGKEFRWTEQGFEGDYSVGFTDDGIPSRDDIERISSFLKLRQRVFAMLQEDPPPMAMPEPTAVRNL